MQKMLEEKVYLYLFILCVILAQGIVGTSLDEDIGESSNILVRSKRVINRLRNQDIPVEIGVVPYIVNIKKSSRLHCVGTILSRHTVITAARCVPIHLRTSTLTVISGSTYTYQSYSGQLHNITDRKVLENYRGSTLTGIALLGISPPFEFSRSTESIELHTGPVLAGMRATVSGWGTFYYGGSRETNHPQRLRSITVPIMNHRECKNIYEHVFPIGDEDICTYHEGKQCGYTDAGAGLVIDDKLVGVYIGPIETEGRECLIKPDVYALVQHFEYGEWIRRNIVH